MQTLKKAAVSSLALLMLTAVPDALLAQRPLCSHLPAIERDRARAAGACRDPAPIIDVPPRPEPEVSGPSIAVPNVVGLSFGDARERLTRFTVNRTYSASAEPGGTVLAQAPTATATLAAGAPINLVLSDGSLVRVPRVTSININDARQRLQEIDVKPQPVVVTSDQRLGTVIEQQPAEGAIVKRGSVVRLRVSAGQEGPEQIDVPNVVGLPFDRARSRLARFTIERVDRPRSESNTAPEGQIVDQTPRAATRAAAGTVIVLTVSSAPRAAIEVFEMPNVIGRSFIDASRTLAEFRVARTDSESATPRGQVLAQTPTAGSAVRGGDTVTLQVSVGKGATAPVNAPSTATARATAPDADAGGWRAVLAIGGGILLGLIAGALVMRQWLMHRRATSAADHAIASLTPAAAIVPSGAPLSTVDILLEESVPDFATKRTPQRARRAEGTDSDSGDQAEATQTDQRSLETKHDADNSS